MIQIYYKATINASYLRPMHKGETHVLIMGSTEETLENPTDLTLLKARGVLVVKAAAPAIREMAIASFMDVLLTKSEGRQMCCNWCNRDGGACVTQTRTTTHKHPKAKAALFITTAPLGGEWENLL
jgi:hypothetical protein